MKKVLLSSVLALGCLLSSVNLNAEEKKEKELTWWQEKLIMYIPNRVMDVLDIFSVSVGAGPKIGLEGRVTRIVTAGAGIGAAAKLEKGYNRQYGALVDDGYNLDFLFLSAEENKTVKSTRFIKKLDVDRVTAVLPGDNVYDFYDGARDYWSIGASAALGLDISADIHIIEIFDMITGFFFIDLKADDMDVYDVAHTRKYKL
jgi:hypothetical protein